MVKCVPVAAVVCNTKEEIEQLEHQLTDFYVDYVMTTICRLDCPAEQKMELLDHVIDTMREKG